jgi:hypothetical protein
VREEEEEGGGRGGGGGGGGEGGGGLGSWRSRGIRSAHHTRSADPFRSWADESLALRHPYL